MKNIFRNIAIVTAIFALALSVMLITNYFQVRGTTPLQTTVMETLKELNDSNSENVELQEQIRQLDLLARKAYFVQEKFDIFDYFQFDLLHSNHQMKNIDNWDK